MDTNLPVAVPRRPIMEIRCKNCGELNIDTKFCINCGNKLIKESYNEFYNEVMIKYIEMNQLALTEHIVIENI